MKQKILIRLLRGWLQAMDSSNVGSGIDIKFIESNKSSNAAQKPDMNPISRKSTKNLQHASAAFCVCTQFGPELFQDRLSSFCIQTQRVRYERDRFIFINCHILHYFSVIHEYQPIH